MKKILIILMFMFSAPFVFSQGNVNLDNQITTSVETDLVLKSNVIDKSKEKPDCQYIDDSSQDYDCCYVCCNVACYGCKY